MDYETIILRSLDDVPEPPASDRLSISGCSVVCYHAHRLADPSSLSDAFSRGVLKGVDDDRSYVSKLRPGAGFEYSGFIDAGPLPGALARVVGSGHAGRLRQSILWFGEEYAVSAIPIVLAVRPADLEGIELPGPISIDVLLRFLALLADPAIAAACGEQAAAGLAARLGIPREGIERTWSIPGSFAIQIWSLDGTDGRDTAQLYQGISESVRYSWEISALLSYNSDHLLEDGLWLRRSRQQVYNQVHSGWGFFDDHMVFVNGDCCLEVAHLPAWLRDRSDFRLHNYGYDSSSIFVWSMGVLRAAIGDDLSRRYRAAIDQLTDRRQLTAAERAKMARGQIQHSRLLERIVSLADHLVEARNRALDERISSNQFSVRALNALVRDLDKYGALAEALHRVREESELRRRDSLLAVVAVSLAGLQIPDFVARVVEWVDGGDWRLLTLSVGLLVLPVAYVGWLLRQRSAR